MKKHTFSLKNGLITYELLKWAGADVFSPERGQPPLVVRPSRGLTHQKTPSQKQSWHAFFTLSSSLNFQFSDASTKYTIIFPILPGSKLDDSQKQNIQWINETIYITDGHGKCVSTEYFNKNNKKKLIFAFRCWPAFKKNPLFSCWQSVRASKNIEEEAHLIDQVLFFAFCEYNVYFQPLSCSRNGSFHLEHGTIESAFHRI